MLSKAIQFVLILLLRFSALLIFDFFVGEQVTFSCTVRSGSSNVTNLSLVEVTKVNSKPSHQKVSFTVTNLQIPEGSEIHVREFICETKYQRKIVSSELAKLIIVKPGKFSGHHIQMSANSKDSARLHSNSNYFLFPPFFFLFVFVKKNITRLNLISFDVFYLFFTHTLQRFDGCLIISRNVLALENRPHFAYLVP